ncbi:MAG TPA: cytochrome c3 family protein [Candidatus Bathyarchaeia archaeon]|nr:cytochrome c3 family protein [Candidatus Bathyarchaeia archaeon]
MDRRILGIIGFLAAAGFAAAAQRPCLECHSGVILKDTVHAVLACTDCHAGLVPREGRPPHQAKKDLPAPTCGASCHAVPPGRGPGENPAAYADSVHGRAYLERHEPEVARCWDCHGAHAIKPAAAADSPVSRRNIPLTCSRCHEDMAVVLKYNIHASAPYREYSQSVHGRSLAPSPGAEYAAVCTDCHGVHDIRGVGAGPPQAREPRTCGGCHKQAYDEYSASIHGREAAKGNPDVPLCVDCHGEHAMAVPGAPGSPTSKARIPDTCSACHARPEIMKKYGVPVDRIATFIDSFHGLAVGLGGREEATCVDCHGVHDIRPAADPGSKVYPANLARTCGRSGCHPKMTAKIAGARIHRDYGRPGSGAPYYVRKVFLWAVLLAAVLSLIYFLPLLARRMGRRGRT